MWSPSSTDRWLLCPVKWAKQQAGEPEAPRAWHPAMLVGTALHAGWARYLDPTQAEKSLPGAKAAATRALVEEWPTVLGYSAGDWEMGTVESLTLTCLERVALKSLPSLLDDQGEVRAVELSLGPINPRTNRYDAGVVDLVTVHGPVDARYIVVTDYKNHWTVAPTSVTRYLSQTERSWQLHQYAYFVQQKFQLPVQYVRSVHVAVTPTPKAWIYPTPISQKRLDTWKGYADSVWAQMDAQAAGTCTPWPNWDVCEKYGAAYRCGYYDTCHGDI